MGHWRDRSLPSGEGPGVGGGGGLGWILSYVDVPAIPNVRFKV